MPSPFPGMDPYIERPDIWPDFHDSLIAILRAALQPLLRPRYVALAQDRLFEVATETIRQPYLQIVEPAAGNRVVTAIEVLSPDNKAAGPGRVAYLQKRNELWDAAANLVEIDLLRQGGPTVRVSAEHLETLRPWHYLVAVLRREPARQELYARPLAHRLPRFAVPLSGDDPDVGVDLQAAFTRCWDEGHYPELLRYNGPPPGPMNAEEVAWCEDLLRASGHRPPLG